MKDLLSEEQYCCTIRTFFNEKQCLPPPFYRPAPYINYPPQFYKKIQNDIQNALKNIKRGLTKPNISVTNSICPK